MDEAKRFKSAFLACDSNKDGKLDRDDLKRALRHVGIAPTSEEITSMFADIESDTVDLSHFIVLIHHYRRAQDTPAELERAFRIFDEDHDGRVPDETVRNVLGVLRNKLPDDQLEPLIQKLSHGGLISISELIRELRPT
jgi:Ca2+-binding EF-hand superfamily protein